MGDSAALALELGRRKSCNHNRLTTRNVESVLAIGTEVARVAARAPLVLAGLEVLFPEVVEESTLRNFALVERGASAHGAILGARKTFFLLAHVVAIVAESTAGLFL